MARLRGPRTVPTVDVSLTSPSWLRWAPATLSGSFTGRAGSRASPASPLRTWWDLIYKAITTPAEIIEPGDRSTSHQVRAVQQIVTYGVKSEPR